MDDATSPSDVEVSTALNEHMAWSLLEVLRQKVLREFYGDVQALLEEHTQGSDVLDALGAELVLEELRQRWGVKEGDDGTQT